MKRKASRAALAAMIKAGLKVDEDKAWAILSELFKEHGDEIGWGITAAGRLRRREGLPGCPNFASRVEPAVLTERLRLRYPVMPQEVGS